MKVEVPKLWPGCTMVCLGDGPSLRQEDVNACRYAGVRVLAVNYSFRMAPWADILWCWHTRLLEEKTGLDASYTGRVFTGEDVPNTRWPIIPYTGGEGIEVAPSGLRHGNNSGYSAINLAIHLGAVRIILLGYDCCDDPDTKKFNWAKDANSSDRRGYHYGLWIQNFNTMPKALAKIGVQVLNASRRTALTCFPCVSLESALSGKVT